METESGYDTVEKLSESHHLHWKDLEFYKATGYPLAAQGSHCSDDAYGDGIRWLDYPFSHLACKVGIENI